MKKIIYKLFCIVLSMITITCISACSSEKKQSLKTKTIKDCAGTEVEISTDIKKVIAPNQPFCSFMIAMGEGDKLIGSHGSVLGHTWAPYFYDKITTLEMYGYKPEAEALLAAGADLVVVKNPAYAETLRKEGIPAIYFGYNNIEELYYAVDLMGEIFGKDAKSYGDRWKDYTKKTIESIMDKTGSLSDDNKKSVYYINGAINPGTIYSTFGGESFTEFWINTIGGKLVTESYKDIEEIDQEVAISLNPDTIFISGYAEYTRRDELMSDPLWTDVTAVKNDSVFLMPTGLVSFDRFSVELPMLLKYSTNVLYPDLYQFDANNELKDFYVEFYGKEFDDTQIENMIRGLNPDGSRMDLND